MQALNSYLTAVSNAIRQEDGARLRQLLELNGDGQLAAFHFRDGADALRRAVDGRLPPNFRGIVGSFLAALVELHRGNVVAACKEFRQNAAKAITDLVKSNAEGWTVPALVGAAHTLKALGEQSDEQLRRQGQPATQLSECGIAMQGMFSATAAAKGAGSNEKRSASLAIGCVMMKIYFKLNTINNCKNVINTINMLRIFDAAPSAYRVTWRYYTGRLAVYDEDFTAAEEDLAYAFRHCLPSAVQNRRKILRYLIPVKMLLGVLPSEALLRQYSLPEYLDVREALRQGDAGLLARTMDARQAQFIQAGTYLLLEKLSHSVYRRLLRKCAIVHARLFAAKANQLPLATLQAALRMQGVVKDDDEAQCLVANLIYRKYVKGYIAFRSRVLVLSKADPFPDLSTVALGDPAVL